MLRPNRIKDLTGHKFGRLTAIEVSGRRGNRVEWRCICDCGNYHLTTGPSLTKGNTSSCGCLRSIMSARRIHGMSRTAIHQRWSSMLDRCNNPGSQAYSDYGGRGITVCDRWLMFENFFSDMGDPPFKGATLERIDNDRGYAPGNVVWATVKDQVRNRRNTKTIMFRGSERPLAEVAELIGVQYKTLWARLFTLNMPIERATEESSS